MNNKTICPNCNSLPLLKIFPHAKPLVNIKCSCGYNETTLITKYLETKGKNNNNTDNQCNLHSKPFIMYCSDCSLSLCSSCEIDIHKTHKMININTIDKDKLNQSMKDCYYHLNHYFSDIYQKAIEPLQKEIKLLTESYELSKKNNTTILNLVQRIIDSYQDEYPSYNTFTNIKTNTYFNITKFTYSIKTSFVKYYFDSYNIIHPFVPIKYINPRNIYLISYLNDKRILVFNINENKKSILSIYNPNKNYTIDMTLVTKYQVQSITVLSDNIFALLMNNEITLWKITKNTYQCIKTLPNKAKETYLSISSLKDMKIVLLTKKNLIVFNANEPYDNIRSYSYNVPVELHTLGKKMLFLVYSQGIMIINIDTNKVVDLKMNCGFNCIINSIDDKRVLITGRRIYILNYETYQIETCYCNDMIKLQNGIKLMKGIELYGNENGFCLFDLKKNDYHIINVTFNEEILKTSRLVYIDNETFMSGSANVNGFIIWKY